MRALVSRSVALLVVFAVQEAIWTLAGMAMGVMWLIQSVAEFLCPPAKRPAYQSAERCFTEEELDAIHKEHCCHVLSKYTSTLDDAHFLEWAGLQNAAPALAQGLCSAVRRQSGDSSAAQITLEGVIIAKSLCEKLDSHTAQDWAFDVLDLQQTRRVSRDHLQAVIQGCMQLAMPDSTGNSQHSIEAGAIAAAACAMSGPEADYLTRDGYAKLCKVSPALNVSLVSLLSNIGASAASPAADPCTAAATAAGEASSAHGSAQPLLGAHGASAAAPSGPQAGPASSKAKSRSSRAAALSAARGQASAVLPLPLPMLPLQAAALSEAAGPGPGSAAIAAATAAARGPGKVLLPQLGWGLVSPAEGLLQPGWVWLLAPGLAPAQRTEWRLLYNSQNHGISYSTFLGRLGEATPTLLLIRDKGGALFGGIAHSPWKKTGEFYGDHACCVFTLLPAAQIYPASGINANLQWCGIGFSQLPNGIGFGGQVGHYGLYIDSTMDQGMSRPAATYASPSLSSSETFQVDVVEAWQLLPPQDDGPGQGANNRTGGSALEKAKEDQKILEWAGVGSNYSAALKDEPIED